MKELFVSIEELEDLECEYNLGYYGPSGRYPGWNWMQDDDAGVVVYFK